MFCFIFYLLTNPIPIQVENIPPSSIPLITPSAKRVILPSVLQPISIATETQFRRDQAGVTGVMESVHPSEAEALEQVIQATGIGLSFNQLKYPNKTTNIMVSRVESTGTKIDQIINFSEPNSTNEIFLYFFNNKAN